MSKSVLTLHVKGVYFDQIDEGRKLEEFRAQTEYWSKRLVRRKYDEVVICRGYPKRDDESRRIRFRYSGYSRGVITHPHFDNKPTRIYAIAVPPHMRISGGTNL